MTTIDQVKQVQESAANPQSDVRVWPDNLTVGQGLDQGDLLLWITDADVTSMEKVHATGQFQLAPGTSQGSRHTVNAADFDIYKPKQFGEFTNKGTRDRPAGHILGYVLVSKCRSLLSHPEHPDHLLPAGVTIQTAGQSDARTLQWAKD